MYLTQRASDADAAWHPAATATATADAETTLVTSCGHRPHVIRSPEKRVDDAADKLQAGTTERCHGEGRRGRIDQGELHGLVLAFRCNDVRP